MIYGFNNPSFYEDYFLRPVRKIDIQLIKDEWENILRIMLSLGLKSTTQASIIRRISSYDRVNKTKRALWKYNIIKSMYVLDYMDSLELRQNVQKALNRGGVIMDECFLSIKFSEKLLRFRIALGWKASFWRVTVRSDRFLCVCSVTADSDPPK